MKTFQVIALALFMTGATAAYAAEAPAPAEQKQTDKSAPDYIRCEKTIETGSLVKARRVCRTNAQWRGIHKEENRVATEAIQGTASGSMSGQ